MEVVGNNIYFLAVGAHHARVEAMIVLKKETKTIEVCLARPKNLPFRKLGSFIHVIKI